MASILSGIQPTGSFHVGNYLGAIRGWIDMQSSGQYECYFAIADLQVLASRPTTATLRADVHGLAVALLASGIDPERSVLFVQSSVPEHAELAWFLHRQSALGDTDDGGDPVLQAAAIALYRATHVPVGEEPHLERSREILRRFRPHYGEAFAEPQPVGAAAPPLMGLDGNAMSTAAGNDIAMLDEPDEVARKLRGAVTDPQRLRRADPGRPEVCNIWSLHLGFTDEPRRREIHAGCTAAEIGCLECKKLLCDAFSDHTAPIRERATALRADPDHVTDVLEQGNEKARARAAETMGSLRERIGLWSV